MKAHILIALLATLLLAGCASTQSEYWDVGAVVALTGNLAEYGQWAQHGIDLAVQDINAQGGIDGKPMRVQYQDNHGQSSDAVAALQALHGQNINYFVSYQSGVALSLAPIVNENEMLLIDFSATTPAYSTPNDNTFRTGVLATQLASDLALLLSAEPRVAYVHINNDFGKGMYDTFEETYIGEITHTFAFEEGETEFATILQKLATDDVEVVVLTSHLTEAGHFLKEKHALGSTFEVYSDVYGIEGAQVLTIAEDGAEGVVYISPTLAPAQKEAFSHAYEEAYGVVPNTFAAQAFDAVQAYGHAAQGCAYRDVACVRENLNALSIPGASGLIYFDINGDLTKPVTLKTVRDGTFTAVNQ